MNLEQCVIRPGCCQSCIRGAIAPVVSGTLSGLLYVCWSEVRALVLFGDRTASRCQRSLRVYGTENWGSE
jgi:hypothetical protein